LANAVGITVQDYITRNALQDLANRLVLGQKVSPLPAGSTLSASVAADITARVNALNAQIVNVAKANGAVVYDLNAFLHRIRIQGVKAGTTTVTGDFMGGFYSLDAVYPAATGHALIANDILTLLNQTYHRNFPMVDVAAVAAGDPATQFAPPAGPVFTPRDLAGRRGAGDHIGSQD
jgi:hypothetical protein